MLHPDVKPGEFIRGYRARQIALNGREGFLRGRKCSTEELFERIGIPLADVVQLHTFVPYLRAIADGGHSAGKPLSLGQHYLRVSIFEAPVSKPRLCESCFREDVGFWGFPYFRREHQLPGVHFCLKHSAPLLELARASAFDELPRLDVAKVPGDGWRGEAGNPVIARFSEVSAALLDRRTMASRQTILDAMRARMSAVGMCEADLFRLVDDAFAADWWGNLELRGGSNRAELRFSNLMEMGSLRARARPHIVPILMALSALFRSTDEILNLFAGSQVGPVTSTSFSDSTQKAMADFRAGVGLELAAAHHKVSVRHLEAVIRGHLDQSFSQPQPSSVPLTGSA